MAVLTIAEALADAQAAGFSGQALITVVAIALAESGLDTLATNTAGNTPPSEDRGILQINNYWHAEVSDACAFDPVCAFVEGYRISTQGTNFTPWSTYTSGAYLKYVTSVSQALGGTTVSTVHWQQPGLETMPEKDGHGDTCGPIVVLDYLHVSEGATLDIAAVDALRTEAINAGLMNVGNEIGMTTDQVAALCTRKGISVIKNSGYQANLDLAVFHADLIAAMLNKQAVIIEVDAAHNLPNNQAGVDAHFILAWGIDSALGYWIANGDTYAALATTTPSSPVWYSIGQIEAAQPIGYIILPAVGANSMSQIPAGWKDDGVTLTDSAGNQIVAGFRLEVLDWPGGWEPDNIALTKSDDSLDSVEYANPSIGKGTRRVFRYRALGWSPTFNNGNVYRIWMGQELLAREQEVRDLQAKLAAVPPPAPPPPPPPPKPNYSADVAAVQTALDTLDSALKANGEA